MWYREVVSRLRESTTINCLDCGNYHAEGNKNSEDDRDTSEAGSHSSSDCIRLEYEIEYPDGLEYEIEDPEESELHDLDSIEEDIVKPNFALNDSDKSKDEEDTRQSLSSSESTAETFSLTDSAWSDLVYHQQNTSNHVNTTRWADIYKQQENILSESKQRMKMYRQCYSQEGSSTSDTINKLKVRKRELEVYRKSFSGRRVAVV